MINLVLFGPPGAGKGTQAEKIKERYNMLHVSTGDVIRGQIAKGTPLGEQAKEQMASGGLVSDNLVIGLMKDYLAANSGEQGTIFDGFPRTTEQAQEFDKMLSELDKNVTVMIALEADEEELVKRLLLRGVDSGRADDMSEEIIRNRIKVYNAQTAIVSDYYQQQGKYVAVNGVGTIDEIFGRICQVLDKYV
ncbi:MAG: adenylate kinase [Rikenellaceae bacterium]